MGTANKLKGIQMNENTNGEVVVEKQANSIVLYIALGVNAALMLYTIYLSGSVAAGISQSSVLIAMWDMTSSGGVLAEGLGILVLLVIGVLHTVNQAIGKKSLLIEKIASILLKLPINIILVFLALFIAFLGYGKFEIGMSGANLNGGGYILDWVNAAALLFLVFFVKKV